MPPTPDLLIGTALVAASLTYLLTGRPPRQDAADSASRRRHPSARPVTYVAPSALGTGAGRADAHTPAAAHPLGSAATVPGPRQDRPC